MTAAYQLPLLDPSPLPRMPAGAGSVARIGSNVYRAFSTDDHRRDESAPGKVYLGTFKTYGEGERALAEHKAGVGYTVEEIAFKTGWPVKVVERAERSGLAKMAKLIGAVRRAAAQTGVELQPDDELELLADSIAEVKEDETMARSSTGRAPGSEPGGSSFKSKRASQGGVR
jgi:hypothetical protein